MRLLAVADRQAEDALDVVGAARKQADDVRHHAGMIVDIDFQHGAGKGLAFRCG